MQHEYVEDYAGFEEHHWWFRARRLILRSLLAREVAWPANARALEVGVGPGLNLYTLYPAGVQPVGMDPDPLNGERARQRGPLPVYTGTVEDMPPPLRDQQFDAICLFDVLEHIADDGQALDLLRARLQPQGRLVLSVPAYQWMWGRQDEVSMHHRRYTRRHLCRLLAQHGFAVERATYFNTLLFPPVALLRLLHALRPPRATPGRSDFAYGPPWLDALLYHVFRCEEPLLRFLNFPFGVSVFVVARPHTP